MFDRFKFFIVANKKKILLSALSVILIILIIIAIFLIYKLKNKSETEYNVTQFISSEKDFSITVSNDLGLDLASGNSYDLLLKSIDDSDNTIAVTKTETNSIYSIEQMITSDQSNYIEQFDDVSNVSDISNGSINDISYYKYSFDTSNIYVEVYWIEKNNYYYVIDFACDSNSPISLKYNITNIMETLVFE